MRYLDRSSSAVEQVGPILVIGLLPLYYLKISLFGVPTNLIELLIGAVFIVVVLNHADALKSQLNWPIILILAGILAGVLVAQDHTRALGILKGWFVVPIAFFFILNNFFRRYPGLKRAFYIAITMNLGFVSLYALGQRYGYIPLLKYQTDMGEYLLQGRAVAFFESPNYLAMYLSPLILLTISQWQSRPLLRVLVGIVVVLGVVSLWLSGSRAGLFSLVVGLITFVFLRLYLGARERSKYYGLGGVILLGGAGVFLSSFFSRDDSARLIIWQNAIFAIREHFFFGIGPGQFLHFFDQRSAYITDYTDIRPYAMHAHSVYLELWLSGGLLTISGFLWLVVRVVKNLQDDVRHFTWLWLGAVAALTSILVHGLVDTDYFKNDLAILFWAIVAMILFKNDTKSYPTDH